MRKLCQTSGFIERKYIKTNILFNERNKSFFLHFAYARKRCLLLQVTRLNSASKRSKLKNNPTNYLFCLMPNKNYQPNASPRRSEKVACNYNYSFVTQAIKIMSRVSMVPQMRKNLQPKVFLFFSRETI